MLENMGMDLRANRQMTTMRCRNEDQEIGEEDAAVVQVRSGSAWEHNGGETWLNYTGSSCGCGVSGKGRCQRKLLRWHLLRRGGFCGESWGRGS